MPRSLNKIIIEGLPIADFNNPRLPINYFDEVSRKIPQINCPRNLLSKIIELNILSRNEILNKSIMIDNEVAEMLSEIINYELNLILTYD